MAKSCLFPIIFSLYFMLFFCKALVIDQNNTKAALVEGILRKVFNLTITSFANIPTEQREKMVNRIEEKINKSAQFLGSKGPKYVKLIMEGVKTITSKNKLSDNSEDISTSDSENFDGNYKIEKHNTNKRVREPKHDYNTQFINDKTAPNIKKPKERKHNTSLQQRVSKSTGNNYIDTMNWKNIEKNYKDKSKKSSQQKMEIVFIDSINVNKVPKYHDSEYTLPTISKEVNVGNNIAENVENVGRNRKDSYYKNVTFETPCQYEKKNTCRNIKSLRTIKCMNTRIPIEKLCDGIKDCSDYSDELDCAIQGINLIRNTTQIMSDIDYSLSENCYTSNIGNTLIATQNDILHNVLQNQLQFLETHPAATVVSKYSNFRKFYFESEILKKTVNEVASVIHSLSSALYSTICSNMDESARKYNDINDTEYVDLETNKPSKSLKKPKLSPKSCICNEQQCAGKCSEECEQICLQRYKLGRWQCNTVSNEDTISLNLLCDGKLDCNDEADENGCSTDSGLAKFQANDMYNYVLKMIMIKSKSLYNKVTLSRLGDLSKVIEKIQRSTTKDHVDVLNVKALREECFLKMTAIYDETRSHASSIAEMYDIYAFLQSLSDKLVEAMKHSHMGNDKIIAPDGCFCRDSKCALLKCSEVCVRACPAEPKITRYYCGGSLAMNQSIPIDAICNGKADCPDNDDEEDCSKDICRKHHLVVLRHNLHKATNIEGESVTSLGEALKSWNVKESASLRILESSDSGRPTPQALRHTVSNLLHDLLMTYAGIATKRRNSDNVIEQFYKLALVVMKTLKSCSK